jgi:hypothetical protein
MTRNEQLPVGTRVLTWTAEQWQGEWAMKEKAGSRSTGAANLKSSPSTTMTEADTARDTDPGE